MVSTQPSYLQYILKQVKAHSCCTPITRLQNTAGHTGDELPETDTVFVFALIFVSVMFRESFR